MSKPLPDEHEVYKAIEEKQLTIPPEIWKVLQHHIGNDLQVISLAAQNLLLTPGWIRKSSAWFAKFLHKVSRQPGRQPLETEFVCKEMLRRVENIDSLMQRLSKTVADDDWGLDDQ